MGAALGLMGASWAAGQEGAGVLAGPPVGGRGDADSLVQRAYEGGIKRLEVWPEEAALRLLRLDSESLGRVEAVLAQRAAVLDEITIKNLFLLQRLGTADAAGDKAGLFAALADLWRETRPLRELPPLRESLREAIPSAERSRFDRLVDEYWREVVRDRRALAEARGEKPPLRVAVTAEERAQLFAAEVARSIERQLGRDGQTDLERLLAGITLTPAQEERVRRLAEDFQARRLAGEKLDDGLLFLQVLAHLNADQRKALLEKVRAITGASRPGMYGGRGPGMDSRPGAMEGGR